jgi:hypothetical protein
MLELLFDNMFVISGGRIFQQIDAVPMDTTAGMLLNLNGNGKIEIISFVVKFRF